MSGGIKSPSKKNKLGVVLVALALVVSLYVATIQASVNLALLEMLRQSQVLATLVPATGKLLGIKTADGSIWSPSSERDQAIVLFGVGSAGHLGDVEYWNQVGARCEEIGAPIDLVGLCITEESCRSTPGFKETITLLSFMDPVQTHALAMGSTQGQAFLFLSGANPRFLRLTRDVDALVLQIAQASLPRPAGAGT